ALLLRASVPQDCLVQRTALNRACTSPIRDEQVFTGIVDSRVRSVLPPSDRLILLNRVGPTQSFEVVYDSKRQLARGTVVPIDQGTVTGPRITSNVPIGGGDYLTAAVMIGGNRFVKALVLATPRSNVGDLATTQLVVRILISGGVALLLSIVATLLLARAFTRPLNELKAAAEDIAAG